MKEQVDRRGGRANEGEPVEQVQIDEFGEEQRAAGRQRDPRPICRRCRALSAGTRGEQQHAEAERAGAQPGRDGCRLGNARGDERTQHGGVQAKAGGDPKQDGAPSTGL